MRLTPLSRACGQTLARDLPPTGPNRIPLLRTGTVITPRFQRALGEHGIHALWVEDGLSEGIEPVELLPEPVRAETAAKVASALDEPGSSGTSAQAAARSASGSQCSQSRSMSEPWRRSRIPALRRRRNRPNGRVSGTAWSASAA